MALATGAIVADLVRDSAQPLLLQARVELYEVEPWLPLHRRQS
jgi:hypothetical protein